MKFLIMGMLNLLQKELILGNAIEVIRREFLRLIQILNDM